MPNTVLNRREKKVKYGWLELKELKHVYKKENLPMQIEVLGYT